MRILILGSCGFVGASLAARFRDCLQGVELFGMDNLSRKGSERNLERMEFLDVKFFHGDIRSASDFEKIPAVDWVIDAAANPSVLAGLDRGSSSLGLMEGNLFGSIHAMEFCRRHGAGLIFLSTSRVYSIPTLSSLPTEVKSGKTFLSGSSGFPDGVGLEGITEKFSTGPPLSLYGASKRASEVVALEYGAAFDFPVWINRCGLIAGAGQFGRADQGIVAFWIQQWLRNMPLRYIGFDGVGSQTRDVLHPMDLADLLLIQMSRGKPTVDSVFNVSGGLDSSFSLHELSSWCEENIGERSVGVDATNRMFDLQWIVLNSSPARFEFDWKPSLAKTAIFEDILSFYRENPEWPRFQAKN